MDKVGKQQKAEQKAKSDATLAQGEKAKLEQVKKQTSVRQTEEYVKIDVEREERNSTDDDNKKNPPKKNTAQKKTETQENICFTDPTLGRKIDFSR